MPALAPAALTLRIEFFLTLQEDIFAKCRLFYSYTGTPPTVAQATAFATSCRTAWSNNFSSLMTTAFSLTQVKVTDLNSIAGSVGFDITAVPGTRAGNVIPANCAVVITRQISRRFRGGHSRIYLPFGVQGDLQDVQTWSAAFQASVSTGIAGLDTAIKAAGWTGAGTITATAVSWFQGSHVFTGSTGRAKNISNARATPLLDTVSAYRINKGVGSQRRRVLHLA